MLSSQATATKETRADSAIYLQGFASTSSVASATAATAVDFAMTRDLCVWSSSQVPAPVAIAALAVTMWRSVGPSIVVVAETETVASTNTNEKLVETTSAAAVCEVTIVNTHMTSMLQAPQVVLIFPLPLLPHFPMWNMTVLMGRSVLHL